MAPNFSVSEVCVIAALFVAIIGLVAVAIVFFGWIAGRVFPPVRHVAPIAFAALACWFLAERFDRTLFTVPWMTAGAVGSIAAILRDLGRRRRRVASVGEDRLTRAPDGALGDTSAPAAGEDRTGARPEGQAPAGSGADTQT